MIDTLAITGALRERFRGTRHGIFLYTDPAYGSIWTLTVYPDETMRSDIPHWTFTWNPFAIEGETVPLLTATSPDGKVTRVEHNGGSPYNVRQFADYVENAVKGTAEWAP